MSTVSTSSSRDSKRVACQPAAYRKTLLNTSLAAELWKQSWSPLASRARLKLRTVQTIVLVFMQLNQSSVSLMAGNLRRRPAEGNEGWQVVPGPRTFPNF